MIRNKYKGVKWNRKEAGREPEGRSKVAGREQEGSRMGAGREQ